MRLDTLFPSSEPYISFKAGQTIFKEGDPGDFMYVLVEGIVEVHVKEKVVGAFEPVESFGEMAVIDPGPRSATVVAKGNCRVARINQARFLVLVRNRPEFAIHIMQMLVERMRWMDSAAAPNSEQAQQITKLQEENQELKALLAAMSPQPTGVLAEA